MIIIIAITMLHLSSGRINVVPGLVLSLREGLEAALIIGIVLGTLRKLESPELVRSVWVGTGGALVVSVILGLTLTLMGNGLQGKAEEIFEGITMLLAAGLLTWAIFWMRKQTSKRGKELSTGVESAVIRGGRWGLASLAFLAVVREGIELSLFLTAAMLSSGTSSTLTGAAVGLLLAISLGWAVYKRLIKLNLNLFFLVTGAILAVFAAGLTAYGIHELNDAGWIPAIIEPLWNIEPILPESSLLGQLMKALLGYNSAPSLTEVLGYLTYLAVIAFSLLRKPGPRLQTANGSSS
jgi:high-affinity iron transporter